MITHQHPVGCEVERRDMIAQRIGERLDIGRVIMERRGGAQGWLPAHRF